MANALSIDTQPNPDLLVQAAQQAVLASQPATSPAQSTATTPNLVPKATDTTQTAAPPEGITAPASSGTIFDALNQISNKDTAANPSRTGDILDQNYTLMAKIFDPTEISKAPAVSDTAVTAAPSSTNMLAAQAQKVSGSTPAQSISAKGLNPDQDQFVSQLAARTHLDPGVVAAWVLSEESGSAAAGRAASKNNDWLNIGYTDTATYGAADSTWDDPITAANATADWLEGKNSIPGYGRASAGVQGILKTAGQSPQTQIAALQNSGWASSHYPNLPAVYSSVAGSIKTVSNAATNLGSIASVTSGFPTVKNYVAPKGTQYGFFPAAGTNYGVNQTPTIAYRLNQLAQALHLHIIGISGFRTPAHSVAVGGFADDPHTKGEASDSPGVENVPESVLNYYGLTRPFPGAKEADHIQLLGT